MLNKKKEFLDVSESERVLVLHLVNEPGLTWVMRRAILRRFGFNETLIDELLVGREEPASDY